MVHGGPWARDSWGFNPEAQWLANRGYVCGPGQLPGLDRLRQGVRQRRQQAVGGGHARRPRRRRRACRRAGLGRPDAGGDLRRFLRRLRRAGRRDLHARRVLLRCRRGRPIQPEDAHRVDPALLGPDRRPVPRAGRQPRDRSRLPVGALTPVQGRPDQDPDPRRPGRQRPPGQAGRVGADRRRHAATRESTTSTCSSATRATASPNPRTA